MTETVGSQMTALGLDLNVLSRTGFVVLIPHVNDHLTDYEHTIDSFGGFLSAAFTLVMPAIDAEWWYERALGLRVKLTCNAGQPAWDGFINQITLTVGSDAEVRGPLMDIGNIISVAYSPMDYSVVPPAAGSEVLLAPVADLISQSRYGKFEKVVSAGQCSDAMASWVSTVSITDLANPKVSGTLNLNGAEGLTIKVECLGLINSLYQYIYNNVAAGSVTLTAKLLAILAADPNNYLSADHTKIMVNTMLVGAAESNNRYAADVVKELVSLGDLAHNNRTLLGVYDNGRLYYTNMPVDLGYVHNLSWNNQGIQDAFTKAMVPPWLVRPGKWLIVPDLMLRVPPGLPLNQDYRTKFIENVKYTAPNTVDLSGGKIDRISQLLARLTYSQGTSGG